MPPGTIDEYLVGVPDPQRDALERLRRQVRAVAPDATETIAYGIPGFRLDGRYFVGFGVARIGCSFYVGRAPILALADELSAYRLGRGTVGFDVDRPIPAALVERLVRARLEERRSR